MATTVEPTRTQAHRQFLRPRRRGTRTASGTSWPAPRFWRCWRSVAWFVIASGKRKEEFAARSLNQARVAAEAGNLPLASSELQKLISAYKGTDAANEAVITLNQVRMINGQNELAVVGLAGVSGQQADQSSTVTPASGLLAAALENSKRWVEAGQRLYPGVERGRSGVPQGEVSGGRGPGLS